MDKSKINFINVFGDYFYISKIQNDIHDKIFENYSKMDTSNIKVGSWNYCSTSSSYFNNELLCNYEPLDNNNILKDEINKHINIFLECMNSVCNNNINYKFIIEKLWYNVYEKNDFQETHNHSGKDTFFSFVYILKSKNFNDDSKLFFVNPKDPIYVLNTFEEIFNNLNYQKHFIPQLQEGSIIIFPSHMEHGVSIHKNINDKRISISGNIKLIVRN